MIRNVAREIAMHLCYELSFTGLTAGELLEQGHGLDGGGHRALDLSGHLRDGVAVTDKDVHIKKVIQ